MAKILTAFWTGTGNTEEMAEIIADTLKGLGDEVELANVSDIDASAVADFEKFALGCPAMGDEELEDGEFLPFYEEAKSEIGSKPVALFGSYSWNDGEWMRKWQEEAKAEGLNLVSEGVSCYEAPDDDEKKAALTALAEALHNA